MRGPQTSRRAPSAQSAPYTTQLEDPNTIRVPFETIVEFRKKNWKGFKKMIKNATQADIKMGPYTDVPKGGGERGAPFLRLWGPRGPQALGAPKLLAAGRRPGRRKLAGAHFR